MTWQSQLADGRVFELRSKSKRYPAPCALVVDDKATGWGSRVFASVDQYGVVGYGGYSRSHNPAIYVDGIRREQFTSARVRQRRPDLERFDADDLKLIRYGCWLDFSGRIRGSHLDMNIPVVVPSEWTIFWLPAFEPYDFRIHHIGPRDELDELLGGAWHFVSHGGPRHLGYKFGHAWATRHSGARLDQIRQFLRLQLPDLIEQPATVVRGGDRIGSYMEAIGEECPVLCGMRIREP